MSFTLEGEKQQPSMVSMYELSHQIVISDKKYRHNVYLVILCRMCDVPLSSGCRTSVVRVWYRCGLVVDIEKVHEY